jgi:hypothetical protein
MFTQYYIISLFVKKKGKTMQNNEQIKLEN